MVPVSRQTHTGFEDIEQPDSPPPETALRSGLDRNQSLCSKAFPFRRTPDERELIPLRTIVLKQGRLPMRCCLLVDSGPFDQHHAHHRKMLDEQIDRRIRS